MKNNSFFLISILLVVNFDLLGQRQKEIFIGRIDYDLQETSQNKIKKTGSYILYFNDSLQRSNVDIDYTSNLSKLKKTLSEKNEMDSLEIERKTKDLIYDIKKYAIYSYRFLNKINSFKKLYKDGTYLVIDSITKEFNFDIKPEIDTILGFRCQKATLIGSIDKSIEIWFANDIKYSVGPYNWTGLPGAILKATWNNGLSIIIAKKIELPLSKPLVDDLSKYKMLTQNDFNKIPLKSEKELFENGN